MANVMSEKTKKMLEKRTTKVLRLASRKKGVRGEEICKVLELPRDFAGYRYRQIITRIQEHGAWREGAGPGSVWKC